MSEESTSTGSAPLEPIPPEGPIGGVPLAKPIHIQRLEQSVRLNSFLDFVDKCMDEPLLEEDKDKEENFEEIGREFVPKRQLEHSLSGSAAEANTGEDLVSGGAVAKAERRADKRKFFNFGKVKKNRRWLKAILLSDSSDPDEEEEDEKTLSKDELREMLRLHKFRRQCKNQFYIESELQQYQYYSAGLLSNYDKFLDHQRSILGPQKTKKTSSNSKLKEKLKRERERKALRVEQGVPQMMQETASDYDGSVAVFQDANRKFTSIKDVDVRRRRIWMAIAKRDIPKAHKHRASVHNNILTNCRKLAQACQKELRRAAIQSQRLCKETPYRARRLTREMMAFWKHYDKVEKEHRRKAEKEAQEQRRLDDEIREAKRQHRKLNFLITQTELYAHFMSRKLTGEGDSERDRILNLLDEKTPQRRRTVKEGVLVDIEADDYDSESMKQRALQNVSNAYSAFETSKTAFDSEVAATVEKSGQSERSFSLSTPSVETEHPQPTLFRGTLKGYQLKGMNWLANLYDCGINGILADEMGLGKTVQSIAFLAHLAETQGIWGPFLVVAPASTLHNWTQECGRFVPKLRVLPYWGNPQDRKTLRKFWGQRAPLLPTEQAEFHMLVTSYQLVVQDIKYFQRIKWHYMILDEAQAIKSSASVRWKLLLGFNCRNRLLLTGTPIQNSMAELWALLHFIMPTLFDSHDEFNEWFSKDIESHVEKQSSINEEQLSRLHMILKPFMLRRVKKDVENELSDKIEILMYCQLSTRQRLFYQAIKNKISIEDLLRSHSSTTASQTQTTTNNLMNLVMQFRKVCNHPELFERRETRSPFFTRLDNIVIPRLLYAEGLVQNNSLKNKVLYNMLSIFTPDHIHHSLFPSHHHNTSSESTASAFSFTRFIDLSPGQLQSLMVTGLMARWLMVFLVMKAAYRVYQDRLWKDATSTTRMLILAPLATTSHPSCASSSGILQDLTFTSWTTTLASHCTHLYHPMAETGWHKRVRTKNSLTSPLQSPQLSISSSSTTSGLASPHKHKTTTHTSPGGRTTSFSFSHSGKVASVPGGDTSAATTIKPPANFSPLLSPSLRPVIVRHCQRTQLPAFLFNTIPAVLSTPVDYYCNDRGAWYEHFRMQQGGSKGAMECARYGSPDIHQQMRANLLVPPRVGGLAAVVPQYGWSKIQIPDKEYLVTDSGKMHVLDELLSRLKDQGHRVLIYSQMTRMIDLLEEFMWHRKHTYMRLDGSSKISDRRDMVAGFQTRSDIFVFLLSTRAGGLGINLTAADTVIFYDSDWNPTVDQQAMDRAHRLGQTKQVTVYRLICKGTIEEHILERAREKSEIQRMVITGGNFKLDQLKPKEVVSLLLDDEDIERKFRIKQHEKRHMDFQPRGKDRKRKKDKDLEILKEISKRAKADAVTDSASVSVDGDESVISIDSSAPSPVSVVSVGSDSNHPPSQLMTPIPQDENSNDGLVIVDDASPSNAVESDDQSSVSHLPVGKQRVGRGGGGATGSKVRSKQATTGVKKTILRPVRPRKGIAAAAMAGARAGAAAGTAAAYAAYGFSLVGKKEQASPPSSCALSPTPSPVPNSNQSDSPRSQSSQPDTKVPVPESVDPKTSVPIVTSPPEVKPSREALNPQPNSSRIPALNLTKTDAQGTPLLKKSLESVKNVTKDIKILQESRVSDYVTAVPQAPGQLNTGTKSLTEASSKTVLSAQIISRNKSPVQASAHVQSALPTVLHTDKSVVSSVRTRSPSHSILPTQPQTQFPSQRRSPSRGTPPLQSQSGSTPTKSPTLVTSKESASLVSIQRQSLNQSTLQSKLSSQIISSRRVTSPVTSTRQSLGQSMPHPQTKSPIPPLSRSLSHDQSQTKPPAQLVSLVKSPITVIPHTKSPVLTSPRSKSPILSSPRNKTPVASSPRTKSPVMSSPRTKSPVLSSPRTKSPVLSSPRTKSPVATSAPAKSSVPISPSAKSPIANSPRTWSPGQLSPGVKSQALVAPLDLRAKSSTSAVDKSPSNTHNNS